MSAEPRTNWTQGQFNAWVASGDDESECMERLDRVPERYRKGVELHVKTVFSLKRWQARQAAEKATPAKLTGKAGVYHNRTKEECMK